MTSLSVKVTLKYVISSRGLQKLSKECQPMDPNLFFQLISCYRYIWWKFQIDRWNQLNCHEIQSLCGAIPYPLASLLLGSYPTTWGGCFLSTHMEKNEEVCAAISVSNFSPLNAFLLSILITFPVRLILRGVLGKICYCFPECYISLLVDARDHWNGN